MLLVCLHYLLIFLFTTFQIQPAPLVLRVLLLSQSCSHKKKIEVPQVGPPPLSSSAVDPDPDRSELVFVIRK